MAAGKTLTVNNTGGTFIIAGAVTAPTGSVDKTGGSLVQSTANVTAGTFINDAGTTELRGPAINLTNVTVNGGRLEVRGTLTLANSPTLTGGTLALLNPAGNTVPNPFAIAGGNVEVVPDHLEQIRM